ncbi:EcsC family protein [Euzebya pacifica]|uniref:EcsC family protein n=1 Tax=Euzebya pacifica TaxID=1608957 RepID=UPI0013DF06A6|nr:EcsC family protein [Euzebya pacifica]
MAEEAMRRHDSKDRAIRSLIRMHVQLAGAQGFLTNLGGFLTLPVALPANIGACYILQTRLAASIAIVHGQDPAEEQVRSALLLCLLGNTAAEAAKKVGVQIGQKVAMNAIKKLPIEVLRAINKKIGFMLLTKYGSKRGVIVLAKGVPVVGGAVGGGFDATSTYAVGRYAASMFGDQEGSDDALVDASDDVLVDASAVDVPLTDPNPTTRGLPDASSGRQRPVAAGGNDQGGDDSPADGFAGGGHRP